jgi:hypothetical protein
MFPRLAIRARLIPSINNYNFGFPFDRAQKARARVPLTDSVSFQKEAGGTPSVLRSSSTRLAGGSLKR